MGQTKPGDVRNWLKSLGALCAGNLPQAEIEARVSAYAPLLAAEFDAGCFTVSSLAAVARQCKFFPTFGEVCTALAAWWKANRPVTTRLIAGPDSRYNIPERRDEPTEHEVEAVHEVVGAWRMEVARNTVGRALAATIQLPKPKPLNPAVLLAVWEKAAADKVPGAEARVATLRKEHA